jgi:hypothetical protein
VQAHPVGVIAAACVVGVVVALVLTSSAHAQSGRCTLATDQSTVALGQVFRLEITCEAQGAEASVPELPDLSAFEVMSRQFSRPMQFTFGMGGQQQIVQSTTRVALLLRPRREGRFEVGPARMRIGAVEVQSGTITISVGGSGALPPNQAPSPGTAPGQVDPSVVDPSVGGAGSTGPPSGPLDGAIYDDQAFIRTVVDRHEAVVGQQVTVTFYLYVRQLATQPQITQQPSSDGFWIHDLLDRNAPPDAVMQRVGTTSFRVYTLRRFAAFPLREGELTIGAMEMHVPVGNPLDMIFGGPQGDLVRTSVPVTIRARTAPAGAAAGLPIHVGTLSAQATLDRAQVPTGDAVTLDLRVEGLGQVIALETPSLVVDGLRVLQPEVDQHTTLRGERVGGDKSVRWLIVPERAGTFSLGPFRWAVLDPTTGAWSVAETAALTLVAAGNPTRPPEDDAAPVEPRIDAPTDDETAAFGPVRTESAFARRSPRVASTIAYRLALGAAPLAVIATAVLLFVRRRRAAREAAGLGDRRAREARKRLDAAAEAIGARDTRAFYAALTQALRGMLEVRLDRAIGSLTHGELRRLLVDRGMNAELVGRLVEELEGAEMARFSAAGGEEGEMRAALERGRALLAEIERFAPTPEEP